MKISMDGKKRNKKQLKIKLSVLIWFLIAIFLSGCGPAYFRAIKKHDIEFMKKYIAEGNELNNMDSVFITPLMAAAQFNDINIAQLLIEKGASASVNYVDIHGVTALHVAKSSEMVQLLLKAGADVNVSSKWGETPLHWAKTGEIVKLLLEAGAELNGLTKLGETPLDVAYYANSK
ncbi:MAG: ankyrin repeat domain-containing protein, partial [Proteobacteria bacterium]|nr:ankyrin repeat domain-containing protein [Pseudomonadota bacterium]MBU1686198.1 ankyrin repeat domain-containing protein [Pseudomonadota bacterium]